MTPEELERLATLLYGPSWIQPLAEELQKSRRTVTFWVQNNDKRRPIPSDVPPKIYAACENKAKLLLAEIKKKAP